MCASAVIELFKSQTLARRENAFENAVPTHIISQIYLLPDANISLSPTSSDSAIIINFHIIVFLLFEQHKIKHLLIATQLDESSMER